MDVDELKAERLHLGQHAVQRRLIGQHAGQHGDAAVHPGLEGGERGADRLAQLAADPDLVPLRPGLALRGHHRWSSGVAAARTVVGTPQVMSLMMILLVGFQARDNAGKGRSRR
ncbi:MAG TPA: hypothetical protein VMG13_10470 [Trebonia sp.]|nr:hypothetical protein [Trebonia sp.]